MSNIRKTAEQEYEEILVEFESLLDMKPIFREPENEALIRKAFEVAYEGHKDTRRKSGEPYIYHPIAVAKIVAGEVGLGTSSVVAALLHDVVEDTDFTLDNIKTLFGENIANIVDGLTKIKGTVNKASTSHLETLRKIILTLTDDLRVIIIKLSDRLHNMRTIASMPETKQLQIISETLYLYVPIAHRLGLYKIKTELEDLCFYHQNPEEYNKIKEKTKQILSENKETLGTFIAEVTQELEKEGIKFKILSRTKTVYSIWNKINKKNIPFDEIFDILAIRIVFYLDEHADIIQERHNCWRIYTILTNKYIPNPDRTRDWISVRKSNGYEALHTTVLAERGKWIEVQIRSERMNEIAERGIAAHWKYKTNDNAGSDELDRWINDIKDFLSSPDDNTQNFLDVFKLNLFYDEIYVFTPKGDVFTLPKDASVLDFAYYIHSDLGDHCLAARVNRALVSRDYQLKNGDVIEILTSEKEKPAIKWLDMVKTAKAKNAINNALREDINVKRGEGQKFLNSFLATKNEKYTPRIQEKILNFYKTNSEIDLFVGIAEKKFDIEKDFEEIVNTKRKNKIVKFWSFKSAISSDTINKNETLDLEKSEIDYQVSKCCNPVPGDKVIGILDKTIIHIHKINCDKAIETVGKDSDSLVKVYWNPQKKLAVLGTIHIEGIDRIGILQNIAEVIAKELKVNIRSISIDTNESVFKGKIDLYVQNLIHINDLIVRLSAIKGVEKVSRIYE